MDRARQCDLAIVGGGLAGGLIALAIHARRPDARVLLVEGGDALGGNHVWSFFAGDVAPADMALVEPLIAHRWDGYDVAFPAISRTIGQRYHAITSERFDAVLRERLPGERLVTGRRAIGVSPRAIVLADGTRIEAGGVIDARGAGDLAHLTLGWQKFVGRELVLAEPHGLARPVVMDATVEQVDGYRFVYLLPFAADRVFVEDTYYSDGPAIDHAALGRRIDRYAAGRGWRVTAVAREEAGALPVVMGGNFDAYWRSGGAHVAKAGTRAALFHPTTGYSLPHAVRLARIVARMRDWSAPALHDTLQAHARAAWRDGGFYRLLDRMMFRAAEPGERYRILQRFYTLDERLIARFYAGRTTMADKARILAGRPPVPVGRAIRALAGVG